MITIIAGSRSCNDYEILVKAIQDSGFSITKIISGGAKGVDSLAIRYAFEHGIEYDIKTADWDKYGKTAGPIRNSAMLNDAEALIALPTKDSKGTVDMIKKAERKGLFVYVKEI